MSFSDSARLKIVMMTLVMESFMYAALFVFLLFNFWRIMIKQMKIKLIPLTVFYVSASVILAARIADCVCFALYYKQGLNSESEAYHMGLRAAIVANYFNIIMGLFQIASIIELFLVLGQIRQAAKNDEDEARPPSLLPIFVCYGMATLLSVVVFGSLVYFLKNYDHSKVISTVSFLIFCIMTVLLTVVTILMAIRLYLLSRANVRVTDGRKALIKYYLVFTCGYIVMVVVTAL